MHIPIPMYNLEIIMHTTTDRFTPSFLKHIDPHLPQYGGRLVGLRL
jgi:hypothetical protein